MSNVRNGYSLYTMLAGLCCLSGFGFLDYGGMDSHLIPATIAFPAFLIAEALAIAFGWKANRIVLKDD